ncbi:MAG: hypothetical protein QI197_04095 [Candidatus Korarchaeota archaeon]|nr:hypothetical protein [Candidatus Korarchaeota archaeon]
MRLRLGMAVSALLTLILSLGIAYLSIQVLKSDPLPSSLGIITSVSLILVSALVFRGDERAILLLSMFYIVLGVLGLFLIPALPSEGMLTFIFSIALGSYLLKHRSDPFRPEESIKAEGKLPPEEPLEGEGGGEKVEISGSEPSLGNYLIAETTSEGFSDM